MSAKIVYYDTLWQVWEVVGQILKENKAVSEDFNNYLHTGGISYGSAQSFCFFLERYKGKFAKRNSSFNITIYRTNKGIYYFDSYFSI